MGNGTGSDLPSADDILRMAQELSDRFRAPDIDAKTRTLKSWDFGALPGDDERQRRLLKAGKKEYDRLLRERRKVFEAFGIPFEPDPLTGQERPAAKLPRQYEPSLSNEYLKPAGQALLETGRHILVPPLESARQIGRRLGTAELPEVPGLPFIPRGSPSGSR